MINLLPLALAGSIALVVTWVKFHKSGLTGLLLVGYGCSLLVGIALVYQETASIDAVLAAVVGISLVALAFYQVRRNRRARVAVYVPVNQRSNPNKSTQLVKK